MNQDYLVRIANGLSPVAEYAVLVVTLFIVTLVRPFLSEKITRLRKKLMRSFTESLEIRSKINDILFELMINYEANRVCLFEYSNSEKSIAGISFEFINITAERCDRHTASIMHEFQKMPVAAFSDQLLGIIKSSGINMIDVNTASEDTAYSLRSYGMTGAVNLRITNKIEDGVVTLFYSGENPKYPDPQDVFSIKAKLYELHHLMARLKH
tara:strand:+ start:303 stop:935 length:633 start_codon:yes stop_codon:yes gene_type:complete